MKTLFTAMLAASALLPAATEAQRFGGRADIGADARGDRPDAEQRADRADWRDRADAGAPVDARGDRPGVDQRADRPDWQGRTDARARADARGERPGFGGDRPEAPGDRGPEARDPGFRGGPQGRDPRFADRPDARRGAWGGTADRASAAPPPPDGRWGNRAEAPQARSDDRRDAARGRPGWENYSAFRTDNFDRGQGDWRAGRTYGDRNRSWDRGWRSDERYDWNRYRAVNRGAYRLPRYYAPSGWRYGYRRFSVGVTLSAGLWGENYWIDDPYAYRLPQAYGPYRWVRYYDDALLIDLRSGRVVDTVYDIFY